ncbi:MAG: hypothetical protein CMJ83_18185 [Planctomycetes bacterium]|nr:hypothetical protein [Planctomycetota bacterium]
MKSPLLTDDGWPRSSEIAALVRRLAAVNWFRRHPHPDPPATRIGHALEEHASRVGFDLVHDVNVLAPWEGRSALREHEGALERTQWDAALRERFATLRNAVIESGRAAGHALLMISGEALLMRPEALPLSQDELWTRLEGPADDRLPTSVVRKLVDRVLWETGMMVGWELVADLVGPNPFVPLLTIYEEGFYPLDLRDGTAWLWAPE